MTMLRVASFSVAMLLSGCAGAGLDGAGGPVRVQPFSLQTLATEHHVCGAAIAIIKSRKIEAVETATGCSDTPRPTVHSVFQAASLSKPVFAYAVLKLIEAGKLELDAPIIRYLPQGYQHKFAPYDPSSKSESVTDQRLRAITVRMVLNHTSGLPNIANGPLAFEGEPGSQWIYSGEGYILLQRAVETVTGQTLDEVMAATVFRPLKMNGSSYVANPRTKAAILTPIDEDGRQVMSIEFTEAVSAFSLYTTVEDYGKFLAGVLNDPKLLDAIVTSPVAVDASLHLEWGLGWGLERTKGNLNIWHWGNNPGYRAFVIASMQSGDGMVLLTNSENGLTLARPLTEKILPDQHDVFGFHMLREGLLHVACKTFGACW